jgi:radial spoke head protein 9
MSDISEEEEIKIPPKDLTELDRLAYVVFAIENDCMLVPVGAFKMTPTH